MKKDNNLGLVILSLPYYLHLILFILSLITIILSLIYDIKVLLYITTIIDTIDILYFFSYKRIILLLIYIPLFIYLKSISIGICYGIILTEITSFIITYILNKILNLIIRKC